MFQDEQRRRKPAPPPIAVVRFPQARVVAGAQGPSRRDANTAPETPPAQDSQVSEPASQSRKDGSSRGGSAMTTITQLIEAASGRSPRKSSHSPEKSGGQSSGKAEGQFSRKSGSVSSRRSEAQSSTASRHGMTPVSRHSARSKHSGASSAHPTSILEEHEEMDKTARAHIEGKAEKKLLGIMGQTSDTPDDYIAPAVRYNNAGDPTENKGKKGEGSRSPKKKLFGMSMPSFGKSTTQLQLTPAPPMPSKAAEVFGTMRPNTAGQQRHQPRPLRPVPRNDASFKSLPPKVYGHSPPRRLQHGNRTPTKSAISPGRRSPPRRQQHGNHTPTKANSAKKSLGASLSNLGFPPTPPEKDTPPDTKNKTHGAQGEQGTNGMAVVPDLSTTAEPVPAHGGKSPTKFRPFTAEEYIKLVEQPRVASVCVEVESAAEEDEENAAIELEGDSHHPAFNAFSEEDAELQHKYPEWWNEQRNKRFSQGEVPQLHPRFYSPSVFSLSLFDGKRPSENTDAKRLLFAFAHSKGDSSDSTNSVRSHPSRPNEVDPAMVNTAPAPQKLAPSPAKIDASDTAARVMQELKIRDAGEAPQGAAGGLDALLPDQSSSRLTEILSGFSPSKSGYNNDPFDNCPSAKPRPLGPLQAGTPQLAPPTMGPMGGMHSPPSTMGHSTMPPASPWDGTLPDGSNILTHFYMCNQHIDVLGRTLYDLVETGKGDARKAAKEVADKADTTAALLGQQHEDIKADLNSMGRTMERVSERVSENNLSASAKLDKLAELVKGDVLERLAQQTKKNADLENSIKALQNMVQELQTSVDAKVSSTTAEGIMTGGMNPFNVAPLNPLPQHRSQPSLVGFHGAANDGGRDGVPRLPTVDETRNDGRHRYNHAGNSNNNNNNTGGHQWYRPAGRDTNENKPFPGSNPYGHVQGPGGQYPYVDAYGQYNLTGHNPSTFTYSYSNGGPK